MNLSVTSAFLILAAALAGAAEDSPEVARLAGEVSGKGWVVFSAHSERRDLDLFLMRPDGS